jgi:hypothetical protein
MLRANIGTNSDGDGDDNRRNVAAYTAINHENKKTPELSPPANYTDRATAACWRS